MNDLIVFSGAALIASFTFLVAIPWMFKMLSIYGLHTLRDQVYEAGRECPSLKATRIYQDVVFLHTYAIHVIRDCPLNESMHLIDVERSKRAPAQNDWRKAVYDREFAELSQDASTFAALDKVTTTFVLRQGLILLRMVTAHPFATLFVLGHGIYLGAVTLFKLAAATPVRTSRRLERLARAMSAAGSPAPAPAS